MGILVVRRPVTGIFAVRRSAAAIRAVGGSSATGILVVDASGLRAAAPVDFRTGAGDLTESIVSASVNTSPITKDRPTSHQLTWFIGVCPCACG